MPSRPQVSQTEAGRQHLAHVGVRPTEGLSQMANNNCKPGTRVVYRDSKTGEFITRREAQTKNPATWEREHVYNHPPKKK